MWVDTNVVRPALSELLKDTLACTFDNASTMLHAASISFRARHDSPVLLLPDKSLNVCKLLSTRGKWCVQRVGPFTSNGGGPGTHNSGPQSSWVRISFPNLCSSKHIQAGYISLVDSLQHPISNPPLSIHHAFIGFRKSTCVAPATSFFSGDLYSVSDCSQFGMEYLGTELNKNFEENIVRRTSMWIEVNDLRPLGSVPLVWWFRSGVRQNQEQTNRSVAVLSTILLYNPIGALGNEVVIPVHRESMIMFWGVLPDGGRLQAAKFHGHMQSMSEAILFAATPGDLKIDYLPRMAFRYVARQCRNAVFSALDAGFTTNAEFLGSLVTTAPMRVICTAERGYEVIDGGHYERAPAVQCFRFHLEVNMSFTVVATNAETDFEFYESSPWITQHAVFILSYVNNASESDVSCKNYPAVGDVTALLHVQSNCMGNESMLRQRLHKIYMLITPFVAISLFAFRVLQLKLKLKVIAVM